MYITMGTAVYGYICYEFLGLEKGGQGWVELEARRSMAFRETFFPARWWCQQSTLGVPRVGRCWQPSCTVRTVGPDLARIPGYSLGVLQYKLVLTHIQ